MKRLIFMVAMAMAIALQAAAMDRREARAEARYLTDKMAWELGLSAREYDRMYEINYRYLRGVNTYDDLYAWRWRDRNIALRNFFNDRQWEIYIGADYFYRPLSWRNGAFVRNVYVDRRRPQPYCRERRPYYRPIPPRCERQRSWRRHHDHDFDRHRHDFDRHRRPGHRPRYDREWDD